MEARAKTRAARKLAVLWGKNKKARRRGMHPILNKLKVFGRLKMDCFPLSVMFSSVFRYGATVGVPAKIAQLLEYNIRSRIRCQGLP
jgi:hypothetical protein